jgi:hypothetical protein
MPLISGYVYGYDRIAQGKRIRRKGAEQDALLQELVSS